MKRFPHTLATFALLLGLVLAGCQSETTSNPSADGTASNADGQMQQASTEAAPAVQTGTYALDGAHSRVGFRIRHLGISNVEGYFEDVDATVTFPSQDLADMQTQATMQTASINTGVDDRDGHLRSGDFFEAEQYPEITFQSTNVTPTGGGNFEMTGDLTMKDTTHQVTLQGQYLGASEGPQGNMRTGFEATGTINRQDFGLTWSQSTPGGELVVGDEVTLRLDVEAVRQGAADASAQNGSNATG